MMQLKIVKRIGDNINQGDTPVYIKFETDDGEKIAIYAGDGTNTRNISSVEKLEVPFEIEIAAEPIDCEPSAWEVVEHQLAWSIGEDTHFRIIQNQE